MISLQKINKILNLLKWIFLFAVIAAQNVNCFDVNAVAAIADADIQQHFDTYSNILASNSQNISSGGKEDFFSAQNMDSAFDADWIEKIALRKCLNLFVYFPLL